MGDPISIGLGVASLASTGLSAAGSMAAGQSSAKGSMLQAAKAQQAAEYARLQADQTDVQMREELRTTLANIDSIRASAYADPNAPTAMAIKAEESRVADRERNTRTLGIRAQANQYDADAAYYRSAAKSYMTGGMLSAAGSIFKGIGGAYSSYKAGSA